MEMDKNTALFVGLLNAIGFSIYKTEERTTSGDVLLSLVIEDLSANFNRCPTNNEIQAQMEYYKTLDSFIAKNPYIIFNEQTGMISQFCNAENAADVFSMLDSFTEYHYIYLIEEMEEKGLSLELNGKRLNKWASCSEILEYGKSVLKNGNSEEQQFYKAFEQEFDTIDLILSDFPDVDLEQVCEYFSPLREKEKEDVER